MVSSRHFFIPGFAFTRSVFFFGAVAFWLSLGGAGAATVISVNLQGANSTLLAPGDVTGAVPAGHWNNISEPEPGGYQTYSGPPIGLNDSTGAVTSVTLTSLFDGIDGLDGGPTSGTAQQVLFGGGLNNNWGSAGFTITGLDAFSSYSVLVYYTAYAFGGARLGEFVSSGNPGLTYYAAGISNYDSVFTLSASTDSGAYAPGNYVQFSGLTAATESITYQNSNNRVFMTGFQIVGETVPEPGVVTLAVAGLVFIASRARKISRGGGK